MIKIQIILIAAIAILLLGMQSCGNKKILTSMQVNMIRLENVPATQPNGNGWDLLGGLPDVQARITMNKQALYSSETYEEASAKNTYFFKRATPFILDELNGEYRIDVYDFDDFSGDEWMGGFAFKPKDYKDQKEFVLTGNTTPIQVALIVEWNYKKKKELKKK
ncbi:MAG: hypothetical protein ACKOZM_07820 [Flavobacteriales bacterium]